MVNAPFSEPTYRGNMGWIEHHHGQRPPAKAQSEGGMLHAVHGFEAQELESLGPQ